ncbi:hypothetical protein Tco_0807694, partial [Tanacetum coccineum]
PSGLSHGEDRGDDGDDGCGVVVGMGCRGVAAGWR